MSKNNDLDAKRFEMPTLGDNLSNVEHGELEKAEISEDDQQVYDELHSKSKWQQIKDFAKNIWQGDNKVGKYLGLGLDVGESFAPGWVARIRDIVQSQTKPTDMKFLREIKRRLKQPSGKAVLTVIAVVAAYFGADVSAEALGDTLVMIIQGLSTAIGGAVALYEMFRDEDKPK